MLTISGLKRFFFLPHFNDMRCKAQTISEIIRSRYNRDPHNGDVYVFMSKNCKRIRLIHYEKNAYYLHEKIFVNGCTFVKIIEEGDKLVYHIEWKDLVTILETPVIKELKLR